MKARDQQPEASDLAGGYVPSLLGLKGVRRLENHLVSDVDSLDVLRRGRVLEANLRPTPDQIYLINCINERSESEYYLGPGNVYGWNRKYGVGVVTSVLRSLHGFPPPVSIKYPYRYVSKVLEGLDG